MAAKKRTETPIQAEPTRTIPPPQRFIEITHPETPIRLGPGTQYATFKAAHLGDRFPFADTSDWLSVIHCGAIAWVRSKAVSASRGFVVTKIKTSLREGPGSHYAPVRKIAAGRTLSCARSEGWHPVMIDGLVYWISAKYSKEIEVGEDELGVMTDDGAK